MFSNLNKPTFGSPAASSSFGLATSTSMTPSPWGNSSTTQLFGKPASTGFGQQSTSTFGQPTTASNTMFPFFPQSNSSGFGSNPTNQSTFGSNVFGQQSQSTTNLFGSNTFGQQKPTGFGFGTQTQQQSNLFGQSTQPQSSLFQPSGSTNLFNTGGGFGSTTVGTTIKYNPVTGTDTMQKSGVTTSINTKHHCITCMKEYEGKSLEELRLEDYQANRKGPQSQFGSAPFGSSTSMFGQATENKTPFGQTTSFGQLGSTAFGQQSQGFGLNTPQSSSSNIFAKPTAFGTQGTSTNGFGGFGTSSSVTNTFGTNQNKPFGTTGPTPLFGTSQPQQQSTPFGSTLFGQNNQNTAGSFFNKPTQTTSFGTGFAFNQTPATTPSSLFQQSKPVFGLGQNTANGGFGQTPAFGQTNQQNTFGASTFAKPLTFGQNQNTFQPVSQTNLFSNNQQKPGSLLGNSGGGLFGTNTFGNNSSSFILMSTPIQQQSQGFSADANQEAKNLTLLASNQFGHSPFLKGLLPLDKSSSPTLYTTNPAEIKKMLESNKKIDEATNSKLKLKLGPPKTQRDNLFEEGNDEDVNKFYKTSCKRLVLKKKQEESKQSIFETTSIYNDLAEKKPEPDVPSYNLSHISDIRSPFTDTESDLTPKKVGNTKLEVKFVNENFGYKLKNFEKFITQNGSPRNESIADISVANSQESLENTMGTIDIPKGLEEPPKKTLSDISITMATSESCSVRDPLSVQIGSEISRSVLLGSSPKNVGPSGIILNRAEYYTLPSVEELDQLVSEDGRCMVKGFTVGRRGYGNVYFPDEINVRNLNLDEIVHFRYKEINMYPDESKKPPIGEGLNRRAQVTLDKVYPRMKETKEIIDDVEQVLAAKFPEQLVEISTKHKLKFIDYRPETGSWVFMVDHFSKYAFTESDEEDCELSNDKQQEKLDLKSGLTVVPLNKKSMFLQHDENDRLQGSKTDMMMDHMNADVESEFTDEGDQRQGDVLHKSMTIDLEGDDADFINPIYEPTDQDLYYHTSQIQMLKAAFFSESECASTMSSMDYYGSYKPELIDVKTRVYHQYRPPQRPKIWTVYLNFASRKNDSMLLKSSRCYSDLGVFKGKSFKVGWASGCRNYTVKFPLHTDLDELLSVSLQTVETTNTSIPLKESVIECIKLARECSNFELGGEFEIPTFKIRKDRNYLMACHKIFKKAAETSSDKQDIQYDDVWSLCYALWGPGRRSAPFVKSRLSSWLKTSVKRDIAPVKDASNQTIEDKLNTIFEHLCCFNVKEAAELAMDANMPALSMIISQVNLPQKQKSHIRHQLESWYNNMYAEHMSLEMLKIYFLLCGTPVDKNVNVFDGLGWKRAFGLFLWYLTSEGSFPEVAIQEYSKAFQTSNGAAEPALIYESGKMQNCFDVVYHVLQLYKDRTYRLVKALNPETYTNVATDYQLSWLLLLFFQSIQVGLIDSSEESYIHVSFSAQLEEKGFWDLAVLPLLFLKDESLKKNLILGILNRHLSADEDNESSNIEIKLLEDFHVPSTWINIVKEEKKNLLSKNESRMPVTDSFES